MERDIIFESSDWHCDPNGLIDEAKEFIRRGKEAGATIVGCGDLLNLLPMGREKFNGAMVVNELVQALDGYPFYYVSGNHDPYPWVVELFRDTPNIEVVKRLESELGGRTYLFTDHLPRLWYRFCKRVGWMASEAKRKASTGHRERQKYNDLTGIIWRNGIKFAQHDGCCVVLGHTHTSGEFKRFAGGDTGIISVIVDGGDLRDGTYVVVDSDAHLEYL
jgi:predicted MPP superfamily phosphohydrolase